jgi:hypothetical protein
MAILRHRDVEAVMPPEVRQRARKAGKDKVDWYAGRRYDARNAKTSAAELPPRPTSGDISSEIRDHRRQYKDRLASAGRRELNGAFRAILSWPGRLSHFGRHRLTVK